ncbi:MAG TPA: hypothetical protein DCF65_14660 [Chloroflexi bacterium]|nr:hypothetical protein [Chloroflexota bacterium]HAF20904.1 hypothetical protein [Chloroflexota bacterium]
MSLLSVVAASRNDGHGLHLLPRMQVFINGLADQVERFEREVELVLVDWNPPSDHRPLSEALTAPAVKGFTVRVITVPPEVHSRLSISENLSFFQMIAKNVGIRRAQGDSVLATNIDILMSDGLFLDSTSPLVDRRLYRTDRVDIAFDPEVTLDADVLRRSPAIRIHQKNGMYSPGEGMRHEQVRGAGSLSRVALRNPVDFMRRVVRKVDPVRYRRALISIFRLPQLHLNACGDFTLMTRASWAELRGYPEWEMFAWSLDGLLLYQAAAAGFSFDELTDRPAFHLEHSSGWAGESGAAYLERATQRGIPVLGEVELIEVANTIWKGRRKGEWRTNLDGWGMFAMDFPETSLPAVSRAKSGQR